MIIAGASAYPRVIDFARIARDRRRGRRGRWSDMAHIAGLVAAGVHPSPVPHADFVTTTTHKTLRGPRGGPGPLHARSTRRTSTRRSSRACRAGRSMHIIAAKAVCFKEALEPAFTAYQRQIVANAARLAAAHRVARASASCRGGTDNHLMLVDVFSQGPHRQGRRGGARQGRHHGQQEHDPVRPEPAADRQRHPHRHAGRDDARHGRGRDGPHRRVHRARAGVARRRARRWRWCGPKSKRCAGRSRCTRTGWPRRARRRASSPTTARSRGRVPEFEPRPGQRDMAAAVARVFETGRRAARRGRHRHRARRSPTSSRPSSAASACSSPPARRTCRSRSTSRTFPSCATPSACRSPPPT